jgi:hypothetical protein
MCGIYELPRSATGIPLGIEIRKNLCSLRYLLFAPPSELLSALPKSLSSLFLPTSCQLVGPIPSIHLALFSPAGYK